ncbi:MAG TPA: tetratricopeptide repeat protein [Solirubrobacterales bacterium]
MSSPRSTELWAAECVLPTARLALRPLVDLAPSPVASLNAEAVTHWLSCERYDDQGAVMYLHGDTRRLLRQGGLRLEPERADRLDTANERWLELVPVLSGQPLPVEERLHLVRLLLYLGFYRDATRVADEAEGAAEVADQLAWLKYLKSIAALALSPDRWDRSGLQALVDRPPQGIGRFVLVDAAARLAGHAATAPADLRAASRYLNLARGFAAECAGEERPIAEARVARYAATVAICRGELSGGIELASAAVSALRHGAAERREFTRVEPARRLSTFVALNALEHGALDDALTHALAAVELDPHCASAAMHAGEALFRLGRYPEAAAFFRRGGLTGVIEQPYCLRRLGECDAAGEPTALPRPGAPTPSLPPMPSTPQRLPRVSGDDPDGRRAIEASEVFARLSAFWTLADPPGADLPYWARQPANAWDVLQRRPEPWFRPVYFQSTQGGPLRDRLLWGALGARRPTLGVNAWGASLGSLAEGSERVQALREAARSAPGLGPVQRAHVARVLLYMGFRGEALDITPIPWQVEEWGPGEAYLAYTNLFIRYVERGRSGYREDAIGSYRRCGMDERSLRTRLMLCIQCGGTCGKAKDVRAAREWRDIGFAVLGEVESCDCFEPDEVRLLASRFWRFASFVPFLEGDDRALLAEARRYEELARECDLSEPLALENLYAVLETRARVCEHLGDLDGAVGSFEELIADVDPTDAKAHINLGAARERRGDLAAAGAAFRRAARFGPPGRELAWYRAGLCHEQEGDAVAAAGCHLRSLEAYPLGKSPLGALRELSLVVGDSYLEAWAEGVAAELGVESGSESSGEAMAALR